MTIFTFLAMAFLANATETPLQPSGDERHSKPINYAAFSPDSKSLVTASDDGTVRVWKLEDCSLVRSLSVEKGERKLPYHAVAYSRAGDKLVAFSRQPSSESLLAVWDAESGKRLTKLSGDYHNLNGRMSGIAFSPDDSEVFCVGNRYSYFWNLKDGKASTHWLAHLDEGKAIYAGRRPMVVCGLEGVLCIDARTNSYILRRRDLNLVWGDVLKEGKFIAMTHDGVFRILDQRTYKVERQFKPRSGSGKYCVVDPDFKHVIVMTETGVVERWRVADGSYAGRLEQGLDPANLYAKKISFGSGKPPRDLLSRHPTSLLLSKDGKTLCYVAGVQFALLPAQWNTD